MIEPFFLAGSRGALFAVYHPPAVGVLERGGVLFVPPFAEEMNKSRRMAALQARRLAAAGFGVLIPDLHGSGESAGDFAEARWDVWRDDMARGGVWLRRRGHQRLHLWGLRLGGLLAADLVGELRATRLLLWQPVLSGERFLQQFLRLRLTSDRLKGGGETMAGLRGMLAAGQSLEVGGYQLHPELASTLERVRPTVPADGTRVDWFELAGITGGALPPASQRVVDEWRGAGVSVHVRTIAGEAFWSTQEIAVAPALLDATLAALDEAP
ncbi:MAG: hydrolase 2, exosortase A system-associated [Candidatus Competibacter sp.]|nr:hydrolase 2, exosortase A system-associated [Candidatus Competibacter sp.]